MKILKYIIIFIVVVLVAFFILSLRVQKETMIEAPVVNNVQNTTTNQTPLCSGIPCPEFYTRQNVEKYLRDNIKTLAPIPATMGGNWYVTLVEMDVSKKFGTVSYEDGHIDQKRNFVYEVNPNYEVLSLKIFQ